MKFKKALTLLPMAMFLIGCNGNENNGDNQITLYSYSYTMAVTNSFNHLKISGEFVSNTLFDDCYLRNGFENIEIPDDLIAGDSLDLELKYPSEIIFEESYPGNARLTQGEILSYSFHYTTVNEMEKSGSSWKESIEKYGKSRNEYIITDEIGHYVSIDEYEGDKLFYTYMDDYYTGNHPDSKDTIMGLYSFNPR